MTSSDVDATGVETRLARIEARLDQLLERLPDHEERLRATEATLSELRGGRSTLYWLVGLAGLGGGGGGVLAVAIEKIVSGGQ